MAERRMFAKTIIDSDAFLDMPQSTQLLYFHFSMRADDDGFINNPKGIMRNVRCNEDDYKLLIVKKFIIPFESGVVVIKHWKIHNYIAKDRYKETKYKDEKSQLILDDNNSYKLNEGDLYTDCVQPVDEAYTQDRLGKDRLGKDRLGKDRLELGGNNTLSVAEAERTSCPFSEIKELYHSICISYPKLRNIDGERKKSIAARWRTYKTLDAFEELFQAAEASSFLKGNNDRNWSADFDWMMKPTNFSKILEHKYDDRGGTDGKPGGVLGTLAALYEEAENNDKFRDCENRDNDSFGVPNI